MPGEISQSYDGLAYPCPRCRPGDYLAIDPSCLVCGGKTWLPHDDTGFVIVTDDDEEEAAGAEPDTDTDLWQDDGGK